MPQPRRSRRRRADSANPAETQPPPFGFDGGRFRPLSAEQEHAVHETAAKLLATLGLSQAPRSMIDRVCAHGGQLGDDGRLRFPRALVEDAVARARRDVVLHARRPGLDLDLSGKSVHFSTGGAAPSLLDGDSLYRDPTVLDLHNAARVVDALDHIHHFSRPLVARDTADPRSLDINTAVASLSGTAKHVSMSVSEPAHVADIAALCYAIAGGEHAFRARPFLTIMVCHVVPPMRFATEACETLEAAVRAGFPVQLISAGQAGATSPASIAGSLVQAVAETLAGLVFVQLIDPDVRAIFAPKPLVADLRTGAMCGGGGEQAILMAGAAQMGRYYDLPTSSIAGITDAKLPDAQHGYEKSLAVTLAAQAGANLVTQACGMQASLLGVSLESYVIDNDMLGAIMRTVRGVEVSEDNLAADVIRQVSLGEGHYLGATDTLQRMKADYTYPDLADRQPPADWEADGGLDIYVRAKARVAEILQAPPRSLLPAEVEAAVRAEHEILLPATAEPVA
ncbi:MAG: trimethylamine methyltransferase family protein [Pseudomonadota bacterium]